MLSGNGRHRRPRQAPAILVAAGVTGSAIAIPLLGATGASAATGTTWDQVANCETEGAWSHQGADQYGGLNIAQEDWDKHGGLDFAERPDQASRNQQITVAEKILADQGVGYWSTCGLLNGLSQDSKAADVDTGVSDGTGSGDSGAGSGLTDSSESSAGSSADSGSDASSPSPSGTPSDNPAKSGTSTDPTTDPTADSTPRGGSQRSDSPSTGAPKQDESDNSWREGGSSALVDIGALGGTSTGDTLSGGKHRGGSADEGAGEGADTAASAGRHAARDDSYIVRPGDTLASIADSLDLQGGWRALYEENKAAIGTDPSRIVPGQTLGLGTE
ncbi:secreted protein [Streptomyces lincolnensis]|uniref:Secreted protein n=1 Tax=Streptomyces lincolnensis TaxID=1915 RepID=A0A1B1MB71_STRLN|nr:transglycosylase family protein [Streptomyces lincolnensis]ANS65743.1 secreted protein [Streptomyces lincolnensis]AXG54494.1 secreted protein [Streptomyces lincolnensis]QMV08862.1 LysM peptidoglycan-binding domain-containing protein [Streptomyces lincolnensis]